MTNTETNNDMKNLIITSTEKIEATEFTMEANVISLDSIPAVKEQEELFGNDDSIVLEF